MDSPLRGAGVEHAAAALSGLTAVFKEERGSNSTWRLGVDTAAPVTDPDWQPEHDAALLGALQGIAALGGLPSGLAARSPEAWEAAISGLRGVKAGLVASGVRPERGRNHKCNPGYDSSCCKQARTPLPLRPPP